MISATQTHIQPTRRSLASAAAVPLTWLQRMRKRRELMGLLSQPDYLLKDLGLQRDEIVREGLKRFWVA